MAPMTAGQLCLAANHALDTARYCLDAAATMPSEGSTRHLLRMALGEARVAAAYFMAEGDAESSKKAGEMAAECSMELYVLDQGLSDRCDEE